MSVYSMRSGESKPVGTNKASLSLILEVCKKSVSCSLCTMYSYISYTFEPELVDVNIRLAP